MIKNLGAIERPKDPRDFLLGGIQAPAQIPASFVPDISWLQRNYQGETAFCGEHAGSHFKAILDHSETGAVERKSPRYGAIKLKNPKSPLYDGFSVDAGTTMTAIFKWLQKAGADDFEPLENNVTLPVQTYLDPTVITPAIDANAATSTITSYAFTKTDYQSLCQAIFQNKAVLLLIKCDDGFWGTTIPTFTQPLYGHFIVGYGYDSEYVYIVDSADPDDIHAFKKIGKQYITSTFIIEGGTAIDIPPAQVQALITESQAVVNAIPTAPLPPAQKLAILSVILNFFQSLFPKVGASPQPPMNYSLFRSKTFWTLVFIFAFNGYTAISGQVPADWSVIINLFFTGLASVFHLTTGQSTTGSN